MICCILKELDKARGKFEAAAGIFQYIMDHLAVPEWYDVIVLLYSGLFILWMYSADLSPLTLQMLVWLNLAQAQECMLLAYLVRQSKRDKYVGCTTPSALLTRSFGV
jgi:hypothetical protein